MKIPNFFNFCFLLFKRKSISARKKGIKAFTLIELLIVIAIVGILSAVIFASMNSAQATARDGRRQSELAQIKKSLEAYRLQSGRYPTTTDANGISLEVDSDSNGPFTQTLKSSGFLSIVPRDPLYNSSGGTYSYKYIATTTDSYTICAKREAAAGYFCTNQTSGGGISQVGSVPVFGGWGGAAAAAVASQISMGNHSCAVKTDGTAWCWGNNNNGQLGRGDTAEQHSPSQVVDQGGTGTLSGVSQISSDSFHSCALKSSGSVWCWGNNNTGQLGIGNTTQQNSPVQVLGQGGIGTLSGVEQLSSGYFFNCVLKADDSVWCWGDNADGELGNNNTTQQNYPVQVVGQSGIGTLSGVEQVSAGYFFACALKTDGTVWCWGWNSFGQLGDNTILERHYPVQVVGQSGIGTLSGVEQISTGSTYHACALKTDGTVWCWGRNNNGQLGDNSTTERHYPVQVVGQSGIGTLSGVEQISTNSSQSCALKTDGTVWCWGANGTGQLGDNSTTERHYPVQVVGQGGTGTLSGVEQISAGSSHTCALKADGTSWCWGMNGNGQLGTGLTVPFTQTSPVQTIFP